MVAISEIRSANAALGKKRDSVTAVFAGATAGIGLATLKAFAKNVPKPKAFIIGRSQAKFQPHLDSLKSINSKGEYTFLETEIALIKNVDAISEKIKGQLGSGKVDLVFVSQGELPFGGRQENVEGLDNATALRYYGRVRLVQNLLPVMSQHARALSVLAGGWEGKLFDNDLDLKENHSFKKALDHFTTTMSLAFDKLAEQNPDKAFLHVYPGVVNTGIGSRSTSGVVGFFMGIVGWLMSWFILQPEEVGERMLYYATTEQYEKGAWTLDWDGTPKNAKPLVEARERGMVDKVADHNQKMFEKALSS